MSQTDVVRNRKGFTLIELMVVIAIIAILTVLGFFGIRQAQAVARDSGRVKVMSQIRAQLEQYYADNQAYPLATTGFYTMATALNLTATNTEDPGCGTGRIGYSGITATWSPVAVGGCAFMSPAAPPSYTYTRPTANTYTLTLVKEGGGTVTYTQPLP